MSNETVETAWESLQHGSHIPVQSSLDSIFSWFQQIECYPKLIWKGRESSTVYFCIGIGTRQSNLPVFTVRAFDTKQPQWDGFPGIQMDTFWCYRVVFINIKRMYIVQINSSTTMAPLKRTYSEPSVTQAQSFTLDT